MRITFASVQNGWLPLMAAVCMTASSGCTSVISSAYLRDAWLDAVEHAAEPTPDDEDRDDRKAKKQAQRTAHDSPNDTDSSGLDGVSSDQTGDESNLSTAAAWSPATLAEAVEMADQRLAQSGGLSAAGRGTLIATLESTPRQDWPVVIEEFTAALAAAHPGSSVSAGDEASPPVSEAVPVPVEERAASRSEIPAALSTAAEPIAPLPPAPSDQVSTPEPDQSQATLEPAEPAFAIQNACFASRVQGWGVIDRFEAATFAPGQELIIYFELDQLASRETADGHATRIDTTLRLVDGDGRRVHEWTFEPLEETCRGQRRDYFARYLVAVPASTPTGPYRLEVVVSDTIAGRTAHASLPLEVSDR
jgi:hypothetical protein